MQRLSSFAPALLLALGFTATPAAAQSLKVVIQNWDEDNDHLASFTTWDVQASYSTPWNGQVTVGARNVLDRDPPQYSNGAWYDMTQHEIYGRVPYLRLEQDF